MGNETFASDGAFAVWAGVLADVAVPDGDWPDNRPTTAVVIITKKRAMSFMLTESSSAARSMGANPFVMIIRRVRSPCEYCKLARGSVRNAYDKRKARMIV